MFYIRTSTRPGDECGVDGYFNDVKQKAGTDKRIRLVPVGVWGCVGLSVGVCVSVLSFFD